MNTYYTYAWLNERKKPFYIGKGKGRRAWQRHINLKEIENVKYTVLILKKNLTEQEAFCHERYMIFVLGREDLNTGILLNKTSGGQGWDLSWDKERRNAVSLFHSGRKRSKETRSRISKAHQGKKITKDHFQKLEAGKLAKLQKNITVVNVKTKIIKSFKSYKDAASFIGVHSSNVSKLANNKIKSLKEWQIVR